MDHYRKNIPPLRKWCFKINFKYLGIYLNPVAIASNRIKYVKKQFSVTLFRNKRFMLDGMFQRYPSKFAIYFFPNQCPGLY